MGSAERIAKEVAKSLDDGRFEETRVYHYAVHGSRDGVKLEIEVWWSPNSVRGWSVKTKTSGPRVLLGARLKSFGESSAIEAVATGDAAFDEKYLVEGAPAKTTRDAMTESVRAALVKNENIELDVDDGIVFAGSHMQRLQTNLEIGANDVQQSIDVVLAMRASLLALPKKDEPNAAAEIATLRAKREKVFARASWPAKILMIVVGTILVLGLLAGLRYGCLPS